MTEENKDKIKEECLEVIKSIEALAYNLSLDIQKALYIGLEDVEYTKQDLRFLKNDYRKFNHIIENMPHFDFIAHSDIPLYCDLDYNPYYLCNRCKENTGSSCKIKDHADKVDECIKNGDTETLKKLMFE